MPKKENSINQLILLAVFSIEERKEKSTFERLVKECFSLFPQRFCLAKCSKWPDTRKLDSSMRKLRAEKLLTGKPGTFFALTLQGRKEAQEIAKTLRQKKLL